MSDLHEASSSPAGASTHAGSALEFDAGNARIAEDPSRVEGSRASRASREDLANSLTHGLGLLASLVAAPALVAISAAEGTAWHVATSVIYGISLVGLYAVSTLHHAIVHPRAKRFFQVLDHCAIYLLIAGSYTPIMLVALRGGVGWTLLTVVWTLAVAGIVFKAFFTGRFAGLSTAVYLLMGWLCVVAIQPLLRILPTASVAWLVAGGVAYTVGTLFYHARRLSYSHALWHLFVLAGSAFHYIAIAQILRTIA